MSSQILTFDRSGLTLRSLAGTSIPLPGIDTQDVSNIVAGTLSNDGVADIVVARDDGTFAWFDGQAGGADPVQHALELPLVSPALAGLERVTELAGIADANGDGRNDVIFTSYLLRTDTPSSTGGRPNGIYYIDPTASGGTPRPLPEGAPNDPGLTILPATGDIRPDGIFHINPNAGGIPTPSGAPSEEPTFTILPFPYPPQPVA